PFGGGGPDRGRLGSHRDLVRDVADVEGQAPQIPVLAETHGNILHDTRLKTFGLDTDTVGGRIQVGEPEDSRTVGGRHARGGSSLVRQLDLHIRNHRAGRIYHDTDQRTGHRLSERTSAYKQHQANRQHCPLYRHGTLPLLRLNETNPALDHQSSVKPCSRTRPISRVLPRQEVPSAPPVVWRSYPPRKSLPESGPKRQS